MPVAAISTEEQLGRFMQSQLRQVATELGWAITDPIVNSLEPYQAAIDDTLEEFGVDTIAEVDSQVRLRALARFFVWDAVVKHMVTFTDWRADGGSYDDATMYKQAVEQLRDARIRARPYMARNWDVERGATSDSVLTEVHP